MERTGSRGEKKGLWSKEVLLSEVVWGLFCTQLESGLTNRPALLYIYMKGGGWVWRLGGTGGALKGVGGVMGRRYI